jgi:hypothetical protein
MTYQDALIPLQGELLNTEIAKPTVTSILKQEIDYHPEIVLAIHKDLQANDFLSYEPQLIPEATNAFSGHLPVNDTISLLW